jgi:hypothetical protein
MLNPRLVKVACPHCGAALRIEVNAHVVTCDFCRVSSFVHVPNRPDPPAPPGNTQGYGHIHVPSKAIKAVGAFVALMVILPIVFTGVILLGVFGFIFWSGSRAPGPSRPVVISTAKSDGPASDACVKAVACCKAVLAGANQSGNQRSCEALRALPDEQCATQAKTFRDSAKQLGKSCD